jgi:hypothetical protein
MLRLINVYLIIASVVNLFFFFSRLFASFPSVDASGLFLTVLVITAVGYCLFSNVVLLWGKKEHKSVHFLQYNFWYNIFQIPGFSVSGFVYFFSAGIEVIPYIVNDGELHIGCRFDLFNAKGSCYYDPRETRYFMWINLVPLAISVFLNGIIQKYRGLKANVMDNDVLNEIQKWFKSQCNGDWNTITALLSKHWIIPAGM